MTSAILNLDDDIETFCEGQFCKSGILGDRRTQELAQACEEQAMRVVGVTSKLSAPVRPDGMPLVSRLNGKIVPRGSVPPSETNQVELLPDPLFI